MKKGFAQIIFSSGLLFASIPVFVNPTATYAATKTVTTYTTTDAVNVRKGAGTKYASLGKLKKGQALNVKKKSGQWYQITFNGKTGYVADWYVKKATVKPITKPVATSAKKVYKTKTAAIVRKGAGTKYISLGKTKKGETLTVKKKVGDWYQVTYKGKTGYIAASYVVVSTVKTTTTVKTAATDTNTYTTTDAVNLRVGAGTKYASLGKLPKGEKLTVKKKVGDWYQITFNGKTAYVAASYVKVTAPKSTTTKATTKKVYKTTDAVNVRKGAGTQYVSLGKTKKGETLTVKKKVGNWYQVTYKKQTAYVAASYVKVTTTTVKPVITKPTTATKPSTTTTKNVYKAKDVVNVRSGAGTSFKSLGKLKKNQTLTVKKKSGSWYQITFNGKTGYVADWYVTVTTVKSNSSTTTTTGTTTTATNNSKVYTTTSAVNYRSTSSMDSIVLGTIPQGEKLNVKKKIGDWYEITYSGKTVYVSAAYVKTSTTTSNTTADKTTAKKYTAGMYKVGTDLPAGEYKFYATTSKEGQVHQYSSSNKKGLTLDADFDNFAYFTLSKGQYVEIKNAYAIAVK